MKTEYPEIEKYLIENPEMGYFNIARKFKLTINESKNIYDYINLYLEPDEEVFHVKSIKKMPTSVGEITRSNYRI